MSTAVDLHTLTGAYALGALSDAEAEEFARHLAQCQACAQEVRELRETAARLALAVAEVPPAALRSRVIAALPDVRQLPPEAANVTSLPHSRRSRWRGLPALVAAACLAAAAVATTVAVDARRQADRARADTARAEQQASAVSAVAAAPDAAFHTGALSGGGTATVVSSARLGKAAVIYHDLPRLPESRVYQLWFNHGGTMVPAGLLATGRPTGSLLLDGGTAGADGVGLTAEPPGGSPAPTGAPLALLPL